MSDYHPISCETYDHYEIAILHGQRLRVTWRDGDAISHVEVVQPCDLQTRNGAEYLLARTQSGRMLELRLDQIAHAQVV